ncbi:hypothetical protein Spb1_00520 [Planctopirus ephydatiae]|uniref:Uncharacterized protein n=1 Tax=Planctopirus ephydatiae TaxID=2528019 RepID=A0A518GHW7_9PLAN|nr:hypothetical protein [Planctopirus ephydatiae]QDV28189.1 hypothetical protein Spb1_00520 [Planctopirus ephydatiae]
MDIPQHFLDEIIDEATADEVGLWFIIGRIRDDLGVEESILLQATTLQCVNQLLTSGAVVAGYYKPDGSGVEAWGMEPKSAVSYIENAWNELGREPDIGEIVVFIGNRH